MPFKATAETYVRHAPAWFVTVPVLVAILLGGIPVDGKPETPEYAEFPDLQGPYLGQTPPGSTAEIFAPDIVKPDRGFHSSIMFNTAGDEAWWTEMAAGRTYCTRLVDETWQTPELLPFDPEFGVREPAYGPGGRFYFLSRRPPPGDPIERERIWSVARTPEGWSAARVIDPVVAAHPTHWQFTFTASGDLYFTSEISGVAGEQDIFMASWSDGSFVDPVNLGPAINGPTRDFCPFVAPDGSYLIFSRTGTGENRRADLYVSHRDAAGAWTEAVNLGEAVNSRHNEVCPVVTPDGKYLFFLRASSECNDVYWIDAGVIELAQVR